MPISLKFHSWLQQGLSKSLSVETDDMGVPEGNAGTVDVGLKIQGVEGDFTKSVTLRGPGDVTNLESSQVSRCEPKAGRQDAEPNYFPFLEFASPEIPWIFTTAKPGSANRLSPWLSLVVLEKNENFKLENTLFGSRKALIIEESAGSLLPSCEEAYAWAHVQEVSAGAAGEINDRIKENPTLFTSRLICPIRLKDYTSYEAFLVPIYQAGVLSGMGGSPVAGDAQFDYAWNSESASLVLPVFYNWSFRTGETDFEELVRRLSPFLAGEEVGIHDLDISNPRGGLNIDQLELGESFTEEVLSFQGVLTSPIAKPKTWRPLHKNKFRDKVSEQILKKNVLPEEGENYSALEHDPVITPPLYGKWQKQIVPGIERRRLPEWMEAVNLSPVHRSVSGLGSEVVRKNQEEFMAEAWEAAKNADEVQKNLRQARLASQVSERLNSNINKLSDESFINITRSAQKQLADSVKGGSIYQTVEKSELLPSGVADKSFHRLTVQQQKQLSKKFNRNINLANTVTEAVVEASKNILLLGAPLPLTDVSYQKDYETPSERNASTVNLERALHPSVKMAIERGGFSSIMSPIASSAAKKDFDASEVAEKTKEQLKPKKTLETRVFKRLKGIKKPKETQHPIPKFAELEFEFSEAVNEKLSDINPELFMPGFGEIPNDSVTLLHTNPKFIESFLMGINHEMSREFAWREFPAGLSQTWFKKFWDYTGVDDIKDIDDISDWKKKDKLGQLSYGNRPGEEFDQSVVLVKGDLLRLYPKTLVYAVKAKWKKAPGNKWVRVTEDSSEIKLPIFKGAIGQQAHFLGFDLGSDVLKGSIDKNEDPGWFFVFEENVTESRFGLDISESFNPTTPPAKINDLSWGHFAESEEALESLSHIPLETSWETSSIEGVEWGKNSAEMAKLTYQLPVRIYFHADALIAEESAE